MKKFFPESTLPAVIILFLATFGLYFNSIHNAFLWDDEWGILTNTYVHEWKYFLNFFSQGIYAGSGSLSYYWRPLVLSVFSLEWHIFHEWVVGYHVINILLHAIDAALIFCLFRLIFRRDIFAFMAGLIFALHPLQTEAVTYISGIADPLATLFILLGTITYVKARQDPDRERLFLLCAFLSFIFALMTKESAIMMPGLLFLADLFTERNKVTSWRDARTLLKRTIPFFIVLAIYIAARLTVLNFIKDLPPSPLALPLYERIVTFFHAFSVYLRLLFMPLYLHMEWILPIEKTLFSPPVLFGALVFIVFIILIITQFRKRPEISFGLAWFFVALSPNMNLFIPTTALLSEHWLYLSIPGFFLAFFVVIEEATQRWAYRPLLPALFIAWIFWLGNLTMLRNRDWADPIIFFTATLKEAPRSYRANVNLGTAYNKRGETEKALKSYGRAIAIAPNESIAYHERATLYQKIGREGDALQDDERSFALSSQSPSFRVLVDYFMLHKEYEKAREILETRLKDTADPIESQKLLLKLFQISIQEKNTALKKEYAERMTEIETKIQNEPSVRLGVFLDTFLSH